MRRKEERERDIDAKKGETTAVIGKTAGHCTGKCTERETSQIYVAQYWRTLLLLLLVVAGFYLICAQQLFSFGLSSIHFSSAR